MLVYKTVVILLLIGLTTCQYEEDYCPDEEMYEPCTCSDERKIHCEEIPHAHIKEVFQRTKKIADVSELILALIPSEDIVPNHLIDGQRIEKIQLNCPDSGKYHLKLHRNAFRSSSNHTKDLVITNCNLNRLNWDFLEGFDALNQISIESCFNLDESLPTLPALKNLVTLKIQQCSGWTKMTNIPPLINGLNIFQLTNSPSVENQLNDKLVDLFLNWISISSLDTLEKLILTGIGLKTVPRRLAHFTNIRELDLSGNNIAFIMEESFQFSSTLSVQFLSLYSSGLQKIEAGAFKGNFSTALVNLRFNNLTRLEETVFKSMLQQMSQSTGTLDVYNNAFDCVSDICHLAWLIRDHPYLMVPLGGVECSNGTYFQSLNTNGFNHCSKNSNMETISNFATTTPKSTNGQHFDHSLSNIISSSIPTLVICTQIILNWHKLIIL